MRKKNTKCFVTKEQDLFFSYLYHDQKYSDINSPPVCGVLSQLIKLFPLILYEDLFSSFSPLTLEEVDDLLIFVSLYLSWGFVCTFHNRKAWLNVYYA